MLLSDHKGILLVILGTVLFASKAIVIKILYQMGMGALELQTLRMLIIFPFYAVILSWVVYKSGWGISVKETMATVMAGIACYHIASYLDLKGLLYISAGLERMILFCYPAMSMLLAWIFLKEEVTSKLFIALLVSYLGIVLFFYADMSFSGEGLLYGSFLVFVASILTAWFMIANQVYSRRIGTQKFTCLAMLAAVTTLLLHSSLVGVDNLYQYDTKLYIGAAVIAIFCTLIPSFVLSAGIKIVGASRAGVFSAVGVLFTILLSNYVLDEPITLMHLAAVALVLLGMRLLK